MLNNLNPYTLRTELAEGITHYFVSFADGQAIHREVEVPRTVYAEFLRFIKIERNLRRSDERHMEQSDLTDETLYERTLSQPKSVEDTILDGLRSEQLRLAIQQLPEVQRRRFVLYHEFGLTYEQIAKMEGCTNVSVFTAVKRAEGKIRKAVDLFDNQG